MKIEFIRLSGFSRMVDNDRRTDAGAWVYYKLTLCKKNFFLDIKYLFKL